VHFVSACTTAEPYAIDLRVAHYPAEEMRINLSITYADNTTFAAGQWFMPDASGAATVPDLVPNATQPYSFNFETFPDRDHDGVDGPTEQSMTSGFISAAQPCTSPAP
jgi:hypothetical protein